MRAAHHNLFLDNGAALRYTRKIQAMGPIGYWPQAEPSGAVALDESGFGRNGAYTAVTLGQPGIGDGRTTAAFDGSTSRNNVYSASLAGVFNGQEVSLMGWFQVSGAGIWTDAASRRLMYFQVDSNNRVYLERITTNNAIQVNYVAGATAKLVSVTSFSPLTWFHFAITVSKAADQVKAYVNGVQSGATQTGLGVFAGALASTLANVGCTGANTAVWSGNIAHAAIFNRALSATDVLSAATL